MTSAWTPFRPAEHIRPEDSALEDMMQDQARVLGAPIEDVREAYEWAMTKEIWKNSIYQVAIDRETWTGKRFPKMIHLSVKRIDREPIHDWRDLQRIKTELVGADHEAVELYPAEPGRGHRQSVSFVGVGCSGPTVSVRL